MTTRDQPTLRPISDKLAFIVKGAAAWKLEGGIVKEIIWSWRHLKDHPGTGDADAAHYLWGLIQGLQHAQAIEAQKTLDEISRRRLNGDTPTLKDDR
jgi:hypothetical protein